MDPDATQGRSGTKAGYEETIVVRRLTDELGVDDGNVMPQAREIVTGTAEGSCGREGSGIVNRVLT